MNVGYGAEPGRLAMGTGLVTPEWNAGGTVERIVPSAFAKAVAVGMAVGGSGEWLGGVVMVSELEFSGAATPRFPARGNARPRLCDWSEGRR